MSIKSLPREPVEEAVKNVRVRGIEDTKDTGPLNQRDPSLWTQAAYWGPTRACQLLCINIMASTLVFLWDSSVWEWVGLYCSFSWAHFLLFVLSNSDVLLFYYILLLSTHTHTLPVDPELQGWPWTLNACICLPNADIEDVWQQGLPACFLVRQKGSRCGWKGR